MSQRIAIIDGLRSPQCKAGGQLKGWQADEIGATVARELLERSQLSPADIDEAVIGNVAQPGHCANIARIMALKAGLPQSMPAVTVHRNCASGMESVTTAAERLLSKRSDFILAGGTESMTHIPLMFGSKMTHLFMQMMKAKTPMAKLKALGSFRPSFLTPIIGIQIGLTDPFAGLNMGQTAEVLSREFGITRSEQDQFALQSHQRALAAQERGFFDGEILSLCAPPSFKPVDRDDGPMADQNLAKLKKLKPYFDRACGTVTVGNACPVTDGAAMMLLCREETAKERGLPVMGYLKDWRYAGLDGRKMGLGPAYATAALVRDGAFSMKDFERVELNEAFAAQYLANEKAFGSGDFGQQALGLSSALGELSPDITNVNGGAIALGHPVGATGARLILTLLRELKSSSKSCGLATLCIGGGQGASLVLEVDS